ncbi:hypothetical protein PBAT_02425 [Paenibacillus antarcticus]|uniref:Uncharacterized protein n=1 Tax=Paenibacillus antarcticus TaxID=253703 RepID=A0A168R2L7_9BACL|nr:hypothetical protein PBAT_02425 [Paenibacillus antarcticus]
MKRNIGNLRIQSNNEVPNGFIVHYGMIKPFAATLAMVIFSILQRDTLIQRIGYVFLKVIIWKCSNDIGGIFNLWVDRMDESLHILF